MTEEPAQADGGGPATLEGTAATDRMGGLHADWTLSGSVLEREFKLSNFRDAFGLATRVALLAEERGHHPDFEVGWGRVKLSLTTHSAGGLTTNDFEMAAEIDKL